MSESCLTGPALIKLMKEMKQLTQTPPEGITVHFSEENLSVIQFDLHGPIDTPFEGGFFRIKLVLPSDYPNSAPKGWFLTRIFHPNVNFKTGEICVSTLKKDWSKTLGLKHVLVVIRCLLIEPNPESALNEEAGKLLLENYADYFQRAKMMTKVHAKASSSAIGSAGSESASGVSNEDVVMAPSASPHQHATVSISPVPMEGVVKEASSVSSVAPSIPSPAALIGEEENSNTSNVLGAPPTSGGTTSAASKKPLTLSAAPNASVSSANPPKPIATTISAASAAEAKAKALKKKSLKRL